MSISDWLRKKLSKKSISRNETGDQKTRIKLIWNKPRFPERKKRVDKKKAQIILIALLLTLFILGIVIVYKNTPQVFITIPQPGKLVGPSTNRDLYVDLVNLLAQNQLSVSYLNFIDNETIEASLSSGVKVLFTTKKDIKEEVASLQLILARFKIEGRKVNKIDLRFKNAFIE
ncbi:MAG: hypothetical protein ACD_13C00138G0003 [uncultured bacterium]|nr:MAG: hypothetical protein ACD_13C00138G0003 [uncultured bacterium]